MPSESSIQQIIQENVNYFGRSLRRLLQMDQIQLLKRDLELFAQDLLLGSNIPINRHRAKVYVTIIEPRITPEFKRLLLEKIETVRNRDVDYDVTRVIQNIISKNVNREYYDLYNEIQVCLESYRIALQRANIQNVFDLENNAYKFLFDVVICKYIQSISQVARYRDLLSNYLTGTVLSEIMSVIFDNQSIQDRNDLDLETNIRLAAAANQRIQATRPQVPTRQTTQRTQVSDIQTPSAFALTPTTTPQPSQFQNIKSKSKPRISSSDSNLENISIGCKELVGEFKSPFTRLGNKLKKICNAYTQDCSSLDDIKQKLSSYSQPYQLDYSKGKKIYNVNPNYTLATLFNVWKNLKPADTRYISQRTFALLDISPNNFDIRFANSPAYGAGVVRDFFQRIINELTLQKVFITRPDMDEPVLRYFLNPDFQPDDTFKQISNLSFTNKSDYELFYKFIGVLMRIIIFNDIGLNFDLSHFTLAHMLYKPEEITDDDYIAYAMLDFPRDFIRNIGNLMKDPDVIDDIGLTFNSQFPLVEESKDKDLKKSNFKEYVILRSKYLLTQKYFDSFKSGFGFMRRLLSHLDVGISQLQNLVTFSKLNESILLKLINNISSNSTASPVRENLISILRNKGTGSTSIMDEQQFYEFVENLLHFWTGYRHYVPRLAYKIVMTEDEVIKSQTCFTTLYIPESIGTNKKMLFDALVLVVQGGLEASAFQILGGKKAIKKKSKKPSK